MPKTVASPEQVEFAKENYLNMTAADIDKKFGVSKGVTRRIYKKFNLNVPPKLTNKLRADKQRKEITLEQDEFIKANIHSMSVKEMANKLNICPNTTRLRCYELGFKDILQQKSLDSRFIKGHEPMNKGTRMTEEQKERIKHTFFQNGHLPHNTKKDGEISVRKDKRGIVYMYYRVSLSKWIPLHHKIWVDAYGEIPKGFNVIFKNKDTLDTRLENLECISNADNMLRNTIHRFPEELKTDIRKLAKLKRIINKKQKKWAN